MAKCPTKVLKAATLEHGLAGTMMPVMDFSRGYCEKDCTLCGEVCPTGAVKVVEEEVEAKTDEGKSGKRKVRLPKVDSAKCVGCGACAHVCPAHALAINV